MTHLGKLVAGAALAASLSLGAAAPADAGIVVGVHLGPGYHHGWCYYHRCYWHGRRWYHRRFYHGYWRYY